MHDEKTLATRWSRLGLAAVVGLVLGGAAPAQEAAGESAPAAKKAQAALEFEGPTRVEAGGEMIRVENPGYACPGFGDLDGDGHTDLLVGQFHKGRIKIYPGRKDGSFGAGKWLAVGGKTAELKDVW